MFKKKEKTPEQPEKEAVQEEKTDAVLDEAPEATENDTVKTPELSPEEQLKAELTELQAKYLYLQAEYQNFRRRAAKDISDARVRAVEDTLVPFLTVSDYLSMADAAANKSDNIEAIRQGLQMIIGQFFKAFEDLGVQKFDSVGKEFDPKLHDAVSNEPSEQIDEGKIIREWSCGFKIGEKLLRPARVVVSSGPEKAAEEDKEKSAE